MPESWPLSTRPPPNAQLSWSTATKEYDRVFVSSLARIAVETTRLVLINRLSVGCVEGFLGQAKPYTPKSAPARSSWNTFLSKPKARVVIRFRSESSIRPCISSVAPAIMITTSNSSRRRCRTPIQYLGVGFTPRRFPGCSACEPNFTTCW